MKNLQKQSYLSLLLLCLAGSVVAAPNDPSGGLCDGLDPSSGLFSTCLQAHSAANRVDQLTLVGASADAIARAQASLDEAITEYAELGGGSVPGFFEIGDIGPAGGIVFYLSEGGGHGLEAAPEDQSDAAAWGCYGDDINGADDSEVGGGAQNTIDILAGCQESGIAAQLAAEYVWPKDQRDGFLPSKDELDAMYTNIGPGAADAFENVGGFALGNYWSSTEDDSNLAWFQNFNYGYQYPNSKYYTLYVRAVRAF